MSLTAVERSPRAVRTLRHDPELQPFLVIWEVTRSCDLVCTHCRADAISTRHPLELTLAEGRTLLDDIATFGPPRPLVVLTGETRSPATTSRSWSGTGRAGV